jgi:hypothetical protein
MDFDDLKTLKTHVEVGLITPDEAKEKAAALFAGFLTEEKLTDIVCEGFVVADAAGDYAWGNDEDDAVEAFGNNVGGNHVYVGKVVVTFKRERKIPTVAVTMPEAVESEMTAA